MRTARRWSSTVRADGERPTELDQAHPKVKAFKQKLAYITRDEFFDFDEVDRVVAAVAADWRAFTIIGLKTGLRPGELLALKWEDLDLVTGQLVVRRTAWRHEEGTPKDPPLRPPLP